MFFFLYKIYDFRVRRKGFITRSTSLDILNYYYFYNTFLNLKNTKSIFLFHFTKFLSEICFAKYYHTSPNGKTTTLLCGKTNYYFLLVE